MNKYTDGQVVNINNIDYEYCDYYKRLSVNNSFDQIKKDPKKYLDVPHILCPICHNDKFTLQYGLYELIANCSCGHHMTVYDG